MSIIVTVTETNDDTGEVIRIYQRGFDTGRGNSWDIAQAIRDLMREVFRRVFNADNDDWY